MIGLLDRYILKSLLYSYLVVVLALMGLTVMLDAFLRIKDFMDAAHSPTAPGFGVLSVMVQYYAVRLPVFYQRISPAIMLMSAMFCMAQLNKNNELTPIRASGISLYRTLAPVFFVAVMATAVSFANQEIVIPSLVTELRSTESILDAGKKSVIRRLDLADERGNVWNVQGFLRGEEIMQNPVLIVMRKDSPYSLTEITAESGRWKRTASDGKPRWHLSNGTETRYSADAQHRSLSASEGDYDVNFQEDGYVVLLPEDANDDPYRLVSAFTPDDMIPKEVGLAYQSSATLRELLAADPTRRDLSMLIQSRFSFPFANIVLLLIGLPFVLGVEGKGAFSGLIVCIVICGAFYGTWALCNELGAETLTPAAAAWLPIAVFGPLGIFLFDWVRT